MKPTKKNAKKLSLRKQTVRTLSADELANAQGGLKLNWGLAGGDDTTKDTSYQTTSMACSSFLKIGG